MLIHWKVIHLLTNLLTMLMPSLENCHNFSFTHMFALGTPGYYYPTVLRISSSVYYFNYTYHAPDFRFQTACFDDDKTIHNGMINVLYSTRYTSFAKSVYDLAESLDYGYDYECDTTISKMLIPLQPSYSGSTNVYKDDGIFDPSDDNESKLIDNNELKNSLL